MLTWNGVIDTGYGSAKPERTVLLLAGRGQAMLFKRAETVRATSPEQLDAALASATVGKVIVEGDDQLLYYASQKVSAAPRRSRRKGGPSTYYWPPVDLDAAHWLPLRRLKWAVIGLVVLLVLSGLVWFVSSSLTPRLLGTVPDGGRYTAIPTPAAGHEAIRHDTTNLEILVPLVWALVAIVAILAVYLITSQAITSGQNVEIRLKVTKKAAGTIVIEKVPVSSARRKAAA